MKVKSSLQYWQMYDHKAENHSQVVYLDENQDVTRRSRFKMQPYVCIRLRQFKCNSANLTKKAIESVT